MLFFKGFYSSFNKSVPHKTEEEEEEDQYIASNFYKNDLLVPRGSVDGPVKTPF